MDRFYPEISEVLAGLVCQAGLELDRLGYALRCDYKDGDFYLKKTNSFLDDLRHRYPTMWIDPLIDDGVVFLEMREWARNWSYVEMDHHCVDFSVVCSTPETTVAALKGRRLDSLISTFPFLDRQTIESASIDNGLLKIEFGVFTKCI